MNIFVTDPNPSVAARHLDDRRLNKMLIESVQLISHKLGGPYKLTHHNHPCVRWLLDDDRNVSWLIRYIYAAAQEYLRRRGKIHTSFIKFCSALTKYDNSIRLFGLGSPEWFCNCSYYKTMDDVFLAYQLTLADKWENDKQVPTWYGVGK